MTHTYIAESMVLKNVVAYVHTQATSGKNLFSNYSYILFT